MHLERESKSSGRDKIPGRIIKDAAELICAPLAIIFNESLFRRGCYPKYGK